jgi:hypothetical protein
VIDRHEPDYWRDLRARWGESLRAAEEGQVDHSARVRQLRWKLPLRYQPIVITGQPGAGKSVIYDALTGHIGSTYFPGGQSTKVDDWRVKTGTGRRRRSSVSVIPGQSEWEDEEQIFNQAFRTGPGPTGVIHVVDWGYDWVWGSNQRRAKAQQMLRTGKKRFDLATLRRQNLYDELTYFRTISEMLKIAWAPPRPPGAWLIVAVTKCDLYWPHLEAARRYYLPTRDVDEVTPFRSALAGLVRTLHYGGLRRLAVLPVSSLGRPYDFSEATPDFQFPSPVHADSSLGDLQRQVLVNRLQRTVGEFNAKR